MNTLASLVEAFSGAELLSQKSSPPTEEIPGVSEIISVVPGPSIKKLSDMMSNKSAFPSTGISTQNPSFSYNFSTQPDTLSSNAFANTKFEMNTPITPDQLANTVGLKSGLFNNPLSQPPAKKAKPSPFSMMNNKFSYGGY